MRRHKQVQAQATKPKPQPKTEPERPPGVENTAELNRQHWELQPVKTRLSRMLRERTRQSVIVTLEIDEQGWFFLVRGTKPPSGRFEGVRVKYVPGVLEVGLPVHQQRQTR